MPLHATPVRLFNQDNEPTWTIFGIKSIYLIDKAACMLYASALHETREAKIASPRVHYEACWAILYLITTTDFKG